MSPSIRTWRLPSDPNQSRKEFLFEAAPQSLDEASRFLPEGAYTTFRTFNRFSAIHLGDHIDRLEKSAEMTGTKLTIQRERLYAAIRDAIRKWPSGEIRIRISLDLTQRPGDLYITLETLHVPTDEQYIDGVRVATFGLSRENPKAKLTSFIPIAAMIRKEIPEGAIEGILLDGGGNFLEGLSSNFFVISEGSLWTASQGVLLGITRDLVLAAAEQLAIPIILQGYPYSRWGNITEAFITSSSRGVLPVTTIDDHRLGAFKPGPITVELFHAYQERIAREIQLI